MNSRLKKIVLLLVAALLLIGASQVQRSLNRDRERLGLTRIEPLENAPPVLAFTTVALGGFRGLISNLLWIRATDLQDQDKYFETVQLADWITKLEPHFASVWVYEAWNMAYNISVKFKDYPDRWRWLLRGIELLRDEALRYNPNDIPIYRELAWFFQHKIGAYVDDANVYYKQQWADEMAEVFGKMRGASFDELVNPKTDDQRRRAALLRDKFKMDPQFMKEMDERYGPLEWRLPEAHAIYWAALGLEEAAKNSGRVDPADLITLRRVIYQSMQLSFQRGRLEVNPFEKVFEFGPNLDIIPKVNEAYEQQMAEGAAERFKMTTSHRNFLRQAIYSLYVNNRIPEAARWFKYLGEQYPDKPILDLVENSLPRMLTLDQYAVACVEADINDLSPDKMKTALEGLLINSYRSLVLDQDDRAAGFMLLARKVWEARESNIPESRREAVGLQPFPEIAKRTLDRLLDTERGVSPEERAVLRTKLRLPAETAATNSPPAPASPSK